MDYQMLEIPSDTGMLKDTNSNKGCNMTVLCLTVIHTSWDIWQNNTYTRLQPALNIRSDLTICLHVLSSGCGGTSLKYSMPDWVPWIIGTIFYCQRGVAVLLLHLTDSRHICALEGHTFQERKFTDQSVEVGFILCFRRWVGIILRVNDVKNSYLG